MWRDGMYIRKEIRTGRGDKRNQLTQHLPGATPSDDSVHFGMVQGVHPMSQTQRQQASTCQGACVSCFHAHRATKLHRQQNRPTRKVKR